MALCSVLLFSVLVVFVMSRTVAKSSKLYLYSVNEAEDVTPVIEYMVPEDESLAMKDRDDIEKLPDWLKPGCSHHRIVLLYAPWCGHCQRFKPHYISVARAVTKAAARMGTHIDFFAVSCTAHEALCQNQEVEGYPTINVHPAGSANASASLEGWEFHPSRVLSSLGIEVDQFEMQLEDNETPVDRPGEDDSGSKHRHVRTKDELFSDALLSFDFALRIGIFMESPTLANSTKIALHDWFELLRMALPPLWKIHRPINAILDDYDAAVTNETTFLATIKPFKPVDQDWSPACTHEDGLPGYTCGLWELFHIMTIGVVEWNALSENDWAIVSTEKAADTLRNYIDNFFGCQVCRENFIAAYDSCAHDRCNRLKPDTDDDDADPNPNDWKQLSLWLWETHNAVNVRLLHERAEREGRSVSHQEEIDVQWPSREACPRCWRADGTWDEELMYRYLRVSYWPDDSSTVSDRRSLQLVIENEEFESIPITVTLLPLGLLAGIAIGLYSKRVQLEKSGRHKKCEDGPYYSSEA